jgi:hypothetical protein
MECDVLMSLGSLRDCEPEGDGAVNIRLFLPNLGGGESQSSCKALVLRLESEVSLKNPMC